MNKWINKGSNSQVLKTHYAIPAEIWLLVCELWTSLIVKGSSQAGQMMTAEHRLTEVHNNQKIKGRKRRSVGVCVYKQAEMCSNQHSFKCLCITGRTQMHTILITFFLFCNFQCFVLIHFFVWFEFRMKHHGWSKMLSDKWGRDVSAAGWPRPRLPKSISATLNQQPWYLTWAI